jgi:hypothetical protein
MQYCDCAIQNTDEMKAIRMNEHETLAGRNLLAIWKRDLPYLLNSPSDEVDKNMLWFYAKSHILLPMEPAVASYLHDEKLPYVWPDIGLTTEIRNACSAKAASIVKDWVLLGGIGALPSLLSASIEYQLSTLFTAKALANSWRSAGVSKIRALQYGPLRTKGYWHDGDIPQAVWHDLLGDVYEPIEVHVPSSLNSPMSLRKQKLTMVEKINRKFRRFFSFNNVVMKPPFDSDIDYSVVRNSIVVFINSGYIERDAYLVSQLKIIGSVCVFLYHTNESRLSAASEKLGVPAFSIPHKRETGLPELASHIESLLAHIIDVPTAGSILAEYIRYEHEHLISACHWLTELFNTYRPSLVCSSQVTAVRNRYFERACLNMAIPVIGIPHAMIHASHGHLFDEKDLFLNALPSRFSENIHNYTSFAIRTCSLKGIFCADEYSMPQKISIPNGKPSVLFLYSACQQSPGLINVDGAMERVKLLKELSSPPPCIQRIVGSVYHKLHPLGVDKELFSIAGIDPGLILPLDSNLGDLLEKVSVVISVNYASSPIQQAINKGIPAILLNTLSAEGMYFVDPAEKVFFDKNAIYIFSVNEMWSILSKYLCDEQYKRIALARQNVLNPMFQSSGNMTLPDLATQVIMRPEIIFNFPLRGTHCCPKKTNLL